MNRLETSGVLLIVIIAFGLGLVYNPGEMPEATGSGSATANIVAAAKSKPVGTLGQVNVNIEPGNGEVLVETNPFVQTDTQVSAKKAKNVAEDYLNQSLENMDVTYEFNISSRVVGGPSAGAAMTLATIAAMSNKEVRKDAVITGTITQRGQIGKVGEIPIKAKAAGNSGMNAFYVPEGQSTKVNYEKVVEREIRGFLIYKDVEYKRNIINISDYTQERFNMKTKEISTIHQAAQKMLKQ